MNTYRIGKVNITATNPQIAREKIKQAVREGRTEYICISNVRTVQYANTHPEYCELMNNAYMCTPDGMPLVWMARLWGLKDVQRTVGPDMFMHMLQDKDSGLKHFLLGDTEDTLVTMKAKFPDANIVGSYSPPFKPLEEYDLQDIADLINNSGADIVWVSLRAPKQDELAVMLKPLLRKKILIGVGAAFRFSLGQYKHPNKLVQKLGLTGLFWRKGKLKQIGWLIGKFFVIMGWSVQILWRRLTGK